MFLDYLALVFLVFGVLVTFYLIIAIHDIPYEIAKKRNHPHQDAIHVAGWVSLMTLHVIWPFLWIWATVYRPERGYGFTGDQNQVEDMTNRISELEDQIKKLEENSEKHVNALNDRLDMFEEDSQQEKED